jgi:hypothetical protein
VAQVLRKLRFEHRRTRGGHGLLCLLQSKLLPQRGHPLRLRLTRTRTRESRKQASSIAWRAKFVKGLLETTQFGRGHQSYILRATAMDHDGLERRRGVIARSGKLGASLSVGRFQGKSSVHGFCAGRVVRRQAVLTSL